MRLGSRRLEHENPKQALPQHRGWSILKPFLHLFPVSVTIAILSLTWRTVYWKDLGNPSVNTWLSAFQFAAKFHEIILIISLSTIVVHRVRDELIEGHGVALGLLTSGYRISSVEYLLSPEYWGASMQKWFQKWDLSLPLPLLAGTATLLAAVVGPSSAVILIPQLGWWPSVLFDTGAVATITPLGMDYLYPSLVDASGAMGYTQMVNDTFLRYSKEDACSELPELGSGDPEIENNNQICPSGGLPDILRWQLSYMSEHALPNFTILDTLTNTLRYLSASNSSDGYSVGSTIGRREARNLGSFWQYLNLHDYTFTKPNKALLSLSLSTPEQSDTYPMKPIVQVKCTRYTEENNTSMEIPSDEIQYLPSQKVVPFPIPDDVDVSKPPNDVINFQWILLLNRSGDNPLTGAVFQTYGADSRPVLYACGILSHWAPVKVWLDPSVSLTILQDSPDPAELVKSEIQKLPSKIRPLRLSRDWLEMINLGPYPSWHLVNLTLMESLGSEFGFIHEKDAPACPGMFCLDQADMVPSLLATSISLYMAEGLSRATSGVETQSFQKHVTGYEWHNLNNYNLCAENGNNYLEAARGSNASHNVEVKWHASRFGYGWGNGGSPDATLIFAIMALLLQALIALCHIGVVIFGGWSGSNTWASTGEMVTLALRSPEPADGVLENTSAGLRALSSWRETLRVREGKRVEVVRSGRENDIGQSPLPKLELHAGAAPGGEDARGGSSRAQSRRVVPGRKYR